ncbi:aromatic amino acid hydroxylase [Pedobacter sp. HMF7647]|uniref:Aromatic amino acid hydroxylase n=1 Tax=Hufsiella arboris TaxID=2695275 RepID=A0A7K1Y764_9SPHI|nr:aromatic amino acid hydroxylase [Hufsiella arboris]MXV50251.1 aromatic amino acid hydroxylase [Hufsiella arboris]
MEAFNDFNNPQVARLPKHLKQYIVDQNYDKYTPVDQAVWRYVMRQNYSYLKNVAYYPYIKGLERAGLSIERIPDLQTMNDNLGKIGWGAVTVDGFIPPSAFMEYQAYRVLVIAADIRQLSHIEYTPAPDIIHESAGHAPIIADSDYNNYLSYFGSIGAKAMFSAKDFQLYEAIRHLSILKEAPNTSVEEIEKAEADLQAISENMGEPSEMALLSRLHWWTVEYGLIGSLEDPKIYGAGLLSSIGESASCMKEKVQKLWYSIEAINYPYDITKPQDQLFVTATFQNLIDVLEEFASTMAFRTGGSSGLRKAVESKNTATAVYSSGLQLTGIFTDFKDNKYGGITFLKTAGPSALALENKQVNGHGKDYHKDGFSSPVGKLKNILKPLEDFTKADLQENEIGEYQPVELVFESGIKVSGIIKKITSHQNKIVLITLENCTVTSPANDILFKPEWGIYDMAVGEKIVSVFNGAADKDAFEEITYISKDETLKHVYDPKTSDLHHLYQLVRDIRVSQSGYDLLEPAFNRLVAEFPNDWLCLMQIAEILHEENLNTDLQDKITCYLSNMAKSHQELSKLINDGLKIMQKLVTQN